MTAALSRRGFLLRSGALGCSLAASPLVTPMTFAAAPWENRLVVILLRGGMDGLDVVQPYGASEFDTYRSGLIRAEKAGENDLDGFFSLHQKLGDLRPMWDAGDLAFAHAVSTPYRDKRSHFDGQDLLEAGTGDVSGYSRQADGWLNRLMQSQDIPFDLRTAFAIGREELSILSGPAEVSNWAPNTVLPISPATERLMEVVYHDDALFRDSIEEAIELAGLMAPADMSFDDSDDMMRSMVRTVSSGRKSKGHVQLAKFAAQQLVAETRIAAFSIGGWDSHNRQAANIGRPLEQLRDVLTTLQSDLGPVWDKTAVIAMTEFGRTVRLNGSGGTDHGTGGAMLFAGGAIRGGRVFTEWPGLASDQLYQERDLMPTEDVRTYAGAVIQGLYGIDQHTIETMIFPGLDMSARPNITL